MLGSQGPEDFFRRCRPQFYQRLSEPLPPFLRVSQRLGECLLADNAPVDEKRSQRTTMCHRSLLEGVS